MITPQTFFLIYISIAITTFIVLVIKWLRGWQVDIEINGIQLSRWLVPLALWVIAILWPILIKSVVSGIREQLARNRD